MAELKIYNTLTREKSVFTPLEGNKVRMYVCGMTVYDYCHLGHGRVLVAFDVITRYLRARGYDVTYVRNITDIDDKILRRAADNNEPIEALTARMIAAMHEDEARMGVRRPDVEPRATAHIHDIVAMVNTLIDKGFAYAAANGDVYYRVRHFKNYGKLSNRDPNDMRSGARIEVDKAKEDPLDFVLWKSAKPNEVSWPSPWGAGRPGWHIECSAMSTCCLGHSFDIHGGGPDLVFPHHENEIAQSEAATGQRYASVWMHAGALRVNNEKMSKSLDNFFTLRDVFEQYAPEAVRYLFVASHYRSPINYAVDSLDDAYRSLTRFYTALEGIEPQRGSVDDQYADRFYAAMDDDFNTPEALAAMFDLVRVLNAAKREKSPEAPAMAYELKRLGDLLGLLQDDPAAFLQAGGALALSADEIDALIEQRNAARRAKNFAESDRIRDQLADSGIILKDSREGTTWVRA